MSVYKFTAINKSKQEVSDTVTAATLAEAKALLSSQGFTLKEIEKVTLKKSYSLWGKKGIPVLERSIMFRYLATMVEAGLPLPEAVEIYAQDSKSPKVKSVLFTIQQKLQQGQALSDAIKPFPESFDKTTLAVIRAGELSGTLTKSLNYLSKQLHSEYKLKQKVKGAMMYPIIILLAMGGVGLILVFFVLPKIAPIFLQMDVELPFFSRIILQGGLFVSEHSLIVFSMLGILLIGTVVGLMRPLGRKIALKIVSFIPAIKHLLDQLDLARFSRTLSNLLSSSVPITEAIEIVMSSLNQQKYQKLSKEFREEIQKGQALSATLRARSNLFPSMLVRMIATGERTGSVDSMLNELAEHYEEEIDSTLSNFTSILEPVLLLLVGIGVAIMVLAVLAPIYSLVGGIDSMTPGR